LNSSLSTASYLLGAYWAAIMLARVILSRVLLRVKGATVVLLSALVSALGVTLLLMATTGKAAALGVLLMGLGFASIYPTTLGLAASCFEHYSGTVFGILFAIALTGGMILPWMVGQLAESYGLRLSLTIGIVNALMIFLLQFLITRIHERDHSSSAAV
jgi:fucose permease